ncbi:hypothetical protein [uncultured Jatrophihabitans sp.]|uniref:hypothetical protein n=1 Tax=uncultured Jatrophihabitans sp. TaxID=1610747 RepID=UPI0035CBA7B1
MLFDALQRRVAITGKLRECCVQKLTRVLDFVLAISPGDTCVDVTAVTVLEPSVVLALRDWKNVLAGRNLRLSIVGASPAVVHALGL